MLLCLDVSNTTIKAGVFSGDRLLGSFRFASDRAKQADEYAMLLLGLLSAAGLPAAEVTGVAISCVVPPLRAVFEELSRKYLKTVPVAVGPDVAVGIVLDVDSPRDVGADRVVNALAVHRLYGGPAIAIAFGTATVFDCVSADGRYLGGAIAPGMVTALESLTRSAAQLFQIELVAPPTAIGRTTVANLQSGLVLGFAGLVEGMVRRLRRELGADARVVATGGLADVVAPATDVLETIDPHLTLKGLRLIHELNA